MREFILREEHLKLLRRAIIRWEDCEFGAPAIDCKRPYGNSDVESDILEILKVKPAFTHRDGTYEYSDEQEEYARILHKETEIALQIILIIGKFEAGYYQADDYKNDWKLVKSK